MFPFPIEILSELILALEFTYEVVRYQQCTSLKQIAMSCGFAQDKMGKWNKSEGTVRFDKIFHSRTTLIVAL